MTFNVVILSQAEVSDIKLLIHVGEMYLDAFGDDDKLSIVDLMMIQEVSNAVTKLKERFE